MHSFTAAVLAVVLLGTLGACSSVAGGRQLPLDHDAMTSSLVHVNPVAVWMPIGRFVLLRRDNNAGALRFLEARRGVDDDENEEARYARYEWFYQPDGRGNFTRASVEHGTRELLQRPPPGAGATSSSRPAR